jgi:hypothetical protein
MAPKFAVDTALFKGRQNWTILLLDRASHSSCLFEQDLFGKPAAPRISRGAGLFRIAPYCAIAPGTVQDALTRFAGGRGD